MRRAGSRGRRAGSLGVARVNRRDVYTRELMKSQEEDQISA